MKHLRTFESFEMVNEGLVDILKKVSEKALAVLLTPFVELGMLILRKSATIEYKWTVIEKILDAKVNLASEIKEIKKKIEESESLTPNQKRELQSKIDKFNKEYPEGFKLSDEKKKLLEKSERIFKEKGEKGNEDWEWFEKKLNSYKVKSKDLRTSLSAINQVDDEFIVK